MDRPKTYREAYLRATLARWHRVTEMKLARALGEPPPEEPEWVERLPEDLRCALRRK